jgi:Arc/MetJ family transcription regulator
VNVSLDIPRTSCIYTWVAKHLVDIDEEALRAARTELGTDTIKDTINIALRRAGADHLAAVKQRLDVLAGVALADREQAWR